MHKADVAFKREYPAKLELVQYLAESSWSHKIMFTNKNFKKITCNICFCQGNLAEQTLQPRTCTAGWDCAQSCVLWGPISLELWIRKGKQHFELIHKKKLR